MSCFPVGFPRWYLLTTHHSPLTTHSSIPQFPLDLFEDVPHRHDALAELERDVIRQPLPHSFFARHDRAVIAIAEMPPDLTVRRAGVFARQVHRQHARVAVDPLALLGK